MLTKDGHIEQLGLLDFSVSLCQVQEVKKIYQQLGQLLNSLFDSHPLVILSIPRNVTDKNLAHSYRLAFNREVCNQFYSQEHIEKILQNTLEDWQTCRLGEPETLFVTFRCGVNEKQCFLGLFSPKREVSDSFMKYLVCLMNTVSQSQEWIRQLKELKNLIHTDDMTGLYNHRKLLSDLNDAVMRYREIGEKFVIFFIDVDYFKKVNDRYGHLAGTHVLTEVSALLKKTLRASDSVYRYGGDEFVMLLPDINFEMAKNIGERILTTVREARFKIKEYKKNSEKSSSKQKIVKLTISMGVAEFPRDAHNQEEILNLADRMMYEAKKRGRQQICHAWDFFKN